MLILSTRSTVYARTGTLITACLKRHILTRFRSLV